MPSAVLTIDIHAASEDVFDLIHDYSRRLEWDTFLREARLLNGAQVADVGVSSRCIARCAVGGAAMDTNYITFSRPTVAAVSMTRGPWFLRSFAASIRHEIIDDDTVRVSYRYSFKAFPRLLAFLIEPVIQWVFRRETSRRLSALKCFVEHGRPTPHAP
ncbi:SRPBCC family protein [Novipirellula sp. SH528]|uniref:SRPBCC family protein n=1 Tax=Novipirellula sp. SH528 TaxID=3454466 RepID=UPI003FA0D545